jgi:hypothetical protein
MLTTKVTKTLANVQANAPSQRPSILLRGEKANLRCPYGPGVSAFPLQSEIPSLIRQEEFVYQLAFNDEPTAISACNALSPYFILSPVRGVKRPRQQQVRSQMPYGGHSIQPPAPIAYNHPAGGFPPAPHQLPVQGYGGPQPPPWSHQPPIAPYGPTPPASNGYHSPYGLQESQEPGYSMPSRALTVPERRDDLPRPNSALPATAIDPADPTSSRHSPPMPYQRSSSKHERSPSPPSATTESLEEAADATETQPFLETQYSLEVKPTSTNTSKEQITAQAGSSLLSGSETQSDPRSSTSNQHLQQPTLAGDLLDMDENDEMQASYSHSYPPLDPYEGTPWGGRSNSVPMVRALSVDTRLTILMIFEMTGAPRPNCYIDAGLYSMTEDQLDGMVGEILLESGFQAMVSVSATHFTSWHMS